MTTYFGDFAEDDTVNIPFNTFDSNDPSASVTITNLADSDIHVHKDGSTTQATTDGATVVIDFDGITGNHMITIDTSADAYYATGSEYSVRVEGTTVDGATINAWVGAFSIERAGGVLALLKGTNSLADIEDKIDTAQADLDTITGSDGVTLATTQGNYAPAKAGDSMDVSSISGDSTAADNLEAMYDGTGYTDSTAPVSRSQVENISTVGAAVHVTAIPSPGGFTMTTGTENNDEDSTIALDGTKHELTDDSGTLDCYYQFDIGGDAAPVSVTFTGNFNSNNDTFNIFANTGSDGTPTWVQIGSITGVNSSANTVHTFNMFNNMIVTDVAGEVQVRINGTGLTSASADIDQVFISKSDTSRSVGYANGAIWVDTVNGTSGTENYVNGVADNTVDSWSSAITIADSLGIADFHIINGSSITFAEAQTNHSLFGDHWTLALGGQNCSGLHVEGATVSGIGTTTDDEMQFEGCDIGTATVEQGHFDFCGFSGTLTMNTADDYEFHNCYDKGAATAIFTKTASVNITAEWVNWSGSITISGIQSGSSYILAGTELGDITLNGADGTVEIRGIYKSITDNRTGSPTLTSTGAMQADDMAAVLVDTTAIETAVNALNDISTGDVNGEVVDALNVDTYAEPGQGTPAATASIVTKLGYVYKAWRNRATTTATQYSLYNDDTTTVDQKSTLADDGTTGSKTEIVSGP